MATLFHKQSWRAAYVSFRRSPYDRRAQRHLFVFAGMLLLIIACLAADVAMLLSHNLDSATRSFMLSVASVILVGGGFRAAYLHFETHSSRPAAMPLVAEHVRVALANQTITLALLLQRAGSEEAVAEQELHPRLVVTTRAEGLKRLEHRQIYNDLLPAARSLFLLRDGRWPGQARARVFTCWEDFEAIRWAMSLTNRLVGIEHAPKHGWRDVLRIARDTERVIQKAKLRSASEIQPKREQAQRYLDRCVARMVTAGLIEAVPENADWQRRMEEAYERDTRADLLVGHEYVREIDAPTLYWTTHRASRRLEMLTLLGKIASGELPVIAVQHYLERIVTHSSVLESA